MKSRLISRFASILLACAATGCAAAESASAAQPDLHAGWLKMYDLQFDEARRMFDQWKVTHPADPMPFVSDAAAHLFAELARLGALESELFVQDERFLSRTKLTPNPRVKAQFLDQIARADRMADAILVKSPTDQDALFVKCLSLGLQADYAALVDK